MVRVVTLDAFEANQRSLRRIPIAVDAAVGAVLPIPVDGAVTLGAQFLRLIPGNLAAGIIDECLSIRWVVAIEASVIDAVRQPNLGVLGKLGTSGAGRRVSAVAFTAPVGESTYRIERSQRGPSDRRRVRCPCGHRRRGNRQQYRGNGQNRGHPMEFSAPRQGGRAT